MSDTQDLGDLYRSIKITVEVCLDLSKPIETVSWVIDETCAWDRFEGARKEAFKRAAHCCGEKLGDTNE